MAVAQRMSEQEYEDFVLSGVEGLWELHDGVLVEKPGMSWKHLDVVARLSVISATNSTWIRLSGLLRKDALASPAQRSSCPT